MKNYLFISAAGSVAIIHHLFEKYACYLNVFIVLNNELNWASIFMRHCETICVQNVLLDGVDMKRNV